MTLEINTTIEAELQKLNEYLIKCEEVEEKTKQLHFVNVKELAEMLHCSLKTSQDIFNLPDFPSLDFAKSKIVLIDALKEWCMTKRSKKDYE